MSRRIRSLALAAALAVPTGAAIATVIDSPASAAAPSASIVSSKRGPTAQCRDGSYSYSQHHRGTCSHHRGVRRWFR
jgi:hypothetical protein